MAPGTVSCTSVPAPTSLQNSSRDQIRRARSRIPEMTWGRRCADEERPRAGTESQSREFPLRDFSRRGNAYCSKVKPKVAKMIRSLQRFHFWCLQSDRVQRGFSSRKRGPRQACLLGWEKSRTSLSCPVQSRSENALEPVVWAVAAADALVAITTIRSRCRKCRTID
jgi:hypothetical protein